MGMKDSQVGQKWHERIKHEIFMEDLNWGLLNFRISLVFPQWVVLGSSNSHSSFVVFLCTFKFFFSYFFVKASNFVCLLVVFICWAFLAQFVMGW